MREILVYAALCPPGEEHRAAWELLALALERELGIKPLPEAARGEEDAEGAAFSVRAVLALAVATSIDALAVGITFAFLRVEIFQAVTVIGCTTFALSAVGVVLGNRFGSRYKSRAEIAGGVILILIGLKILLEHLGIL